MKKQIEPTFTFKIFKNDLLVQQFVKCHDDLLPFAYLQRNQPFSIHYALTYGGWRVEWINELSKQKGTW